MIGASLTQMYFNLVETFCVAKLLLCLIFVLNL